MLKQAGVVLVVCAAFAWTACAAHGVFAQPDDDDRPVQPGDRDAPAAEVLQCHAQGKMAMPLVTYDQTRPWAEAIRKKRSRAACPHGPPSVATARSRTTSG